MIVLMLVMRSKFHSGTSRLHHTSHHGRVGFQSMTRETTRVVTASILVEMEFQVS